MEETEKAKLEIAEAAKKAVNVISDAASQAAKILSSTAEESLRTIGGKTSNIDHDLLIELKTLMGGVKTDIKELKDGTSNKIDNHEKRIISLETSKTKQTVLLSIGIGILSILTSMLIYHLFGM